eukprot:6193379-Pleurochrysis_carterae.AAC.4
MFVVPKVDVISQLYPDNMFQRGAYIRGYDTGYFQHPPVQAFRGRASWHDVHDDIAHREKRPGSQRLGEEVRQFGLAAYEGYGDVMRFNTLAHKESDVGSDAGGTRSANAVRRYTVSFVASDATIISVSQDDKAAEGCFFDAHKIAAWLYMKTYPDVECRVAQLESENPSTECDAFANRRRRRLSSDEKGTLMLFGRRRAVRWSGNS